MVLNPFVIERVFVRLAACYSYVQFVVTDVTACKNSFFKFIALYRWSIPFSSCVGDPTPTNACINGL